MMVWLGVQESSVAETRAKVQAIVNPQSKEAIEAFSSYVDSVFPYRANMEDKAKTSQRDVLEKWVDVGKLRVRPQDGTPDRQEPLRQTQRTRGKTLLGRARAKPGFKRLEEAWIPERSGAGSARPDRVRRPARLPIKRMKKGQ
jgi:hypothetical protein